MAELLERCAVCRGLLDEEDLFCANCGTEAPPRDVRKVATRSVQHNFECQGCGASMSYDASTQSLRCPFCGSEALSEAGGQVKTLAPHRALPFVVNRDAAVAAMRQWLGQGFWRPGDLSQSAAVTKMTAVYVPYWVFEARTFSYWTADSSKTPLGARGDWYPLSGEHRGSYAGLLIGASGVLTPAETAALCPFDLSAAVPADELDLGSYVTEQFRVQRKYARPLARRGLEDLERQACRQYVPGRCRNLQVNMRLEGLSSEPVVVPVWIMAYRYQDCVYRFLLNGQTGKATGQAPTSWKKVAVAVGVGLLVLAVGALLLAAINS